MNNDTETGILIMDKDPTERMEKLRTKRERLSINQIIIIIYPPPNECRKVQIITASEVITGIKVDRLPYSKRSNKL